MMLQGMGERLSAWAQKYIPDPFLFALLLTFVTMALGVLLTPHNLFEMIGFWYGGFWNLLSFAMQMSLILVTGYALATTEVIQKIIGWLAGIPENTRTAAVLVAIVAVISGYINWGLAIVVAPLLAREVARRAQLRGIPMHYPLLGAAAYMGLAVWHGGLSGSAPLTVATEGHFLEQQIGIVPVTETLFSPLNIAVAALMIPGIPLLINFLSPTDPDRIVTISDVVPDFTEKEVEPQVASIANKRTMADKLENSFVISLLAGMMGVGYIIYYFVTHGPQLNLNIVNFTFLSCGILLHRTPINYGKAVAEGARGCAGIILQFPFYAGIMGMMQSSGLIVLITTALISICSTSTYPIVTFLSACLVNIFVPSGGGQWAIQGPVVVQAARQMGVPLSRAIMAFSYGDQWTNLFQPFWALVLLGIMRLKASHIMGYCMAVMFVGFLFYFVVLFIF